MLTPIINFFKNLLNKKKSTTVVIPTKMVSTVKEVKPKKPRKPRIKKSTK